MEQVQAFLTDGSLNSENFYVDEDARAVPNTVSISAGGCFTFSVLLEPPFTVGIKPTSPAKTRLVNAVNNAKCASVKLSLVRFTQEYLKLADDIDAENAENAEEEVATQHDDEFDKFTMESINEAKKRDQMRYAEMDAELQRIRNQFDVAGLQKSTVDRILSDYQSVLKTKHFGWKSQPCGKALSTWSIDLFDFDKNTPLEKDMREVEHRTGKKCVEMLMTFPPEYPFKPPFIRVVRPRFVQRTGRVTIGGSICTQLLTDDGWKPIYDIESIIETIRQQITDPEAGARVDTSNTADYTEAEARDAFARVAQYHHENGW